MDYKSRFMEAVESTILYGLSVDDNIQFEEMKTEEKRDIFQASLYLLRNMGLDSSSALAGNCIPVHANLQAFLLQELGEKTYITIGDRRWDDGIYCKMSEEKIKKELEQPSLDPINAHVWLTLRDGTILDCTSEAHLDMLDRRGDYPVEECIHIYKAYSEPDYKKGFHQPFLVGADFLYKTHSIAVHAIE